MEPLLKIGPWLMEGTRLAADWVRGPELLKGCSRGWRGLLPSACESASHVSRRCTGLACEPGAGVSCLAWTLHPLCTQELALHRVAQGPCMLRGSPQAVTTREPNISSRWGLLNAVQQRLKAVQVAKQGAGGKATSSLGNHTPMRAALTHLKVWGYIAMWLR